MSAVARSIRAGIWLAVACSAFSLTAVASFPIIASALVAPLEGRFDRAMLASDAEITGIVVLGGGVERVREAIRLAREYRSAQIVISGDTDEMRQLVLDSGIAAERVTLERNSKNTFENALLTTDLLQPRPSERWLLVTSASHMPRAMGSFRKRGFSVEPWPVADGAPDPRDRLQGALHEWGGLVAYWLRGRTDALFPAPVGGETSIQYDLARDRLAGPEIARKFDAVGHSLSRTSGGASSIVALENNSPALER
jgi:uncharacterized SAM-binding protein YcdF (DUF218 family)